jgi:Rne/Rng family ribonuclease
MAKEICISSTPHETRLAILEDDLLTEIYYERENEYTLAGSIYKGRVTRVLPGMQSAFVDLGLERDAFLYVTDFMEEQEDSADFERVPNGNGVSQASREAQTGREPRENRSARAPISIEADPRSTAGSEGRGGSAGSSSDAGSSEDEQQGTRRWRGRRGRRRGGRPHGPREAGQSPSQSQNDAQLTSGLEIEVETGPTVYEETVVYGGQAAFSESPAARFGAAIYNAGEDNPVPHPESLNEPIVLPGESLSRYHAKSADFAARPETRSTAPATIPVVSGIVYKPTTLVEEVPGWDGGAELPGESLSRYRGKSAAGHAPLPAAPETVEQARAVEPSAGSLAKEASTPQEADMAPQTIVHDGEEVSATGEHPVAVEPQVQGENTVEAHFAEPHEVEPALENKLVEHVPVEPAVEVMASEPHAHASGPDEVHHDHAVLHHEEPSFEPENASASYRIDPAAPSEYRFSPIVEDEPEVAVSLDDVPHPRVAADSSTEAADPLLDESAPSAHLATAEVPSVDDIEFGEDDDDLVGGPLGFAPGSGPLEEEIIEEEEYDSEPIRAYSDEGEFDDLEEQTLDNLAGAELSEMVRDAHLEQRIGASPDGEGGDTDIEFGETEGDLDEEGEDDDAEEAPIAVSSAAPAPREGRTDDGRRGGRGPRRRGRPNGGGGAGSRRANSQLSDLPIISELLKQGQEILVQIAKEPIAKKGARITSHIALPGRFLVFMPTVNHVGVSRKISSDEERQRLKRILISEKGTTSGGFIVRTAADGASEDDLRADIRFLISLWNEIKQRADEGKAPALIYHDLNLIERVLRDQVSANFSTIWVDNEAEYERILRFLQRFEPSLVRRVKLYTKETPLFEQFGIQDEISKALKSKVWLKSGGSIVINQTEALVAIDINTGKYVGKTARLEDTILKTNLDAIPEIVRQIRLRDLGGIIVIDFIDMDERKNRHKVMAALEEELKSDRAPSKVLQFNDFGLVAITRKRVKQSLERTLSVQCEVCTGTGMVKSPTTVCNEIYTELRKMQRHLERGDVLLRVHPEVVKTLKAGNARWLNEMEEMASKTIIVKSDPTLHPEQFDIQ